jgi:pimeloyl-ACP methyl ester carboxylesterase
LLGHKPFLVLADFLTRRGIAVLRLDDRGVGGSSGSIKSSTSEDFAGDIVSGLNFLKGRKEIDAKKIGLIGHSEGGIIAPLVAARSKDVAFIVLMAGTGVPGTEILKEQAQLILKATGATESELKFQQESQKRLIDIIVQEKDEKVAAAKLATALKEIRTAMPEAVKKALGNGEVGLSEAAVKAFNNTWFRYFLTYDPRTALRAVRCPVLAVNGEKEHQRSSRGRSEPKRRPLRARARERHPRRGRSAVARAVPGSSVSSRLPSSIGRGRLGRA